MKFLRYLKLGFLLITCYWHSVITVSGQSIFFDAMKLSNKSNITTDGFLLSNDTVYTILAKYSIKRNPTNSEMDIEFDGGPGKNPFIIISGGPHASSTFLSQLNPFSAIGGLDVTSIADGFAKFIVKRTKQELTVAFFEKFKDAMADTIFRDLHTVFPQTYRALTIIGDEIYNYEAYIQTLRESFENDLATLTTNLPSIVDNHPDFFSKYPWLEATLKSGCYVAGELRDKVHPGDILKDFPTEYLEKLNLNWKGAIQTLQLVSASLRDSSQSDSMYWVSTSQIKKVINDTIVFKIYLGLLYQQALQSPYDSIKFQGTTLIKVLNSVADSFPSKYNAYKNYINRFGEKANKLNMLVKNYKKLTNDSLKFEQYAAYFNASINLLEYTAEAGKLPYVNLPHLSDTLKDYFDVAHSSCDLVLDVNRRNYGAAIIDAVHIYEIIIDKYFISSEEYKEAEEKVKLTGGNIVLAQARISQEFNPKLDDVIMKAIKRYSDKVYFYNELKSISPPKETIKKLFKYGTFMATIVQAKSSDDVEKAIEAFALPSGSSRIKRESAANVSLNAYCGAFAGYEKIKGVDAPWPFAKINATGITAPIGIAASIGKRKFLCLPHNKDGHWAFSIFVSLIDLGAVTAYRFKNPADSTKQTEEVPTIQLKDIFSPGAFLSIGIPKTPLSINLGTQIGPNLRNVGNTENDYSNTLYWRYSVSICVDIPILNFSTRSDRE